MAEKKIEINERNASNTGWDTIYPKTKADIVMTSDGGNVESKISTLNAEVSGVGTKIDNVKSDTNTIKSDVSTIKTYTDSLEGNLGSNSDGASATGSVHAKLKDIKSNLGGSVSVGAPNSFISATSIIANGNRNAFNVTGKGVLRHFTATSDSTGVSLKIFVDGVEYLSTELDGLTSGFINTNYTTYDGSSSSLLFLTNSNFGSKSLAWKNCSLNSIALESLPYKTTSSLKKFVIGDGIPFNDSLVIWIANRNSVTVNQSCSGFYELY